MILFESDIVFVVALYSLFINFFTKSCSQWKCKLTHIFSFLVFVITWRCEHWWNPCNPQDSIGQFILCLLLFIPFSSYRTSRSSLCISLVFLGKAFNLRLSLSTQEYKWVPGWFERQCADYSCNIMEFSPRELSLCSIGVWSIWLG